MPNGKNVIIRLIAAETKRIWYKMSYGPKSDSYD